MTKLELYQTVLENIKEKIKNGEMKESESLYGNLAYFCDICTKGHYEMTTKSLKTLSTNEFCWFVYISLHNDLMEKAKTETEKKFLRADFKTTRILWKLKLLKGFDCVLPEEYPEWFFLNCKESEM